MHSIRHKIAPYTLLQEDFRDLDSAETLRTTWNIERLILLQSVQGHAHEGHCKFRGKKYPNTSIDDISRALGLDPFTVRSERQKMIDDVKSYVDRVIAGDDDASLSSEDGNGLLGSSMFNGLTVSGRDVLRGLYLGGLRDDTDTRFTMEAKYDITIGGGKCYLVDTKVMDRMDLDAEILAHGAHEDMIDYYKQEGLIVADSGPDTGDLEYLYIRHRRGLGASDDTAIVAAGILYGLGTAVGVFLADAVDTIEKHVVVFSDQDEDIARKIKSEYPGLDVSEDELLHLAYLSAIPSDSSIQVPDSSLRHLLLIDRGHDATPVECHLLYVQNKRHPNLRIGYEDVPAKTFYDYVANRVQNAPHPD